MRVLVTGYLGPITGTVLSRLLMANGHQVIGADIHLYERCTFGDEPRLAVEVLRKDIRDLDPDDLAGCEAVVHLAGLCNDPLGDLLTARPPSASTIGHDPPRRGGPPGRGGAVRLSSTCSVYGAAGQDWVDETSSQARWTP